MSDDQVDMSSKQHTSYPWSGGDISRMSVSLSTLPPSRTTYSKNAGIRNDMAVLLEPLLLRNRVLSLVDGLEVTVEETLAGRSSEAAKRCEMDLVKGDQDLP